MASRADYRLRDVWLPPSLLSLTRVPLAICFPFAASSPWLAIGVLALAGLSDVLDGFVARRFGLVTAVGCALDPITDKLFVVTVALTMLYNEQLSLLALACLSTREIGELPLVLWLARAPQARGTQLRESAATLWGKLATSLQFATVAWALVCQVGLSVWLGTTAGVGLFSAASYWRRALRLAHRA